MEGLRALADSRKSRRRLKSDSDMIRIVHGCALVLHKGPRHKGFGRGFDRLARAGKVQVRESRSDYFINWWTSLSREGHLRNCIYERESDTIQPCVEGELDVTRT
jgi:hypothetical protein